MAKKLTPKQEAFCKRYIVDFNGTKSAIEVGYSKKSARIVASQNLANPMCQEYIAELMKKRNDQVEVDAKYVLRRLIDQDQAKVSDLYDDQGALKPVHEWSDAWQRGLIDGIETIELFETDADGNKVHVGFTKKLKLASRMQNLTLLGRHVDVQAWLDKAEITDETSRSDRIKQARERRQKGKKS